MFLKQAQENRDLSEVKLPLFRGTDTNGDVVRFLVTDASSKQFAKAFGANFSPKLRNAAGTAATTKVTWGSQGPTFPFTPDFSPPPGQVFPAPPPPDPCPVGTSPTRPQDDIPVCSTPSATGANGQGLGSATGANSYSPLVEIQTKDGPVVINAPHIVNSTGQQDRVLKIEGANRLIGRVTYVLTAGLHKGRTIHYITTDSSIPILASLEATTFAPALNRTASTPTNATIAGTVRSGLAIVTNGPTGLGNPERQGILSALTDNPSGPLNVIQFTPDDKEGAETLYSPIWDIHLATWKDGFTKSRQSDFDALIANPGVEASDAGVTTPPGTPPHPVFFWTVNCPIVSTDGPGVMNSPAPT